MIYMQGQALYKEQRKIIYMFMNKILFMRWWSILIILGKSLNFHVR